VRRRPKAAYRALITDPDKAFEFFLAEKLNMTVAQLRASMSGQEYLEWWAYFSHKAQLRELEELKMKAVGGRRGR
jgi:hypothetical protein